jgi:hypothetical protein
MLLGRNCPLGLVLVADQRHSKKTETWRASEDCVVGSSGPIYDAYLMEASTCFAVFDCPI